MGRGSDRGRRVGFDRYVADDEVTMIVRASDQGRGRRIEDGARRIPDAGQRAPEMDASDHVPDGSFVAGGGERESFKPSIDWDALPDREAQAGCHTGTAGATQSASAATMADTTLPEGGGRRTQERPIPDFCRPPPFCSAGITLLEASELDASAGDAGGNSRDVSDADAVANGGDRMSPRGENSENRAWFKSRCHLKGGWGRRPEGHAPRSEASALGARWLSPGRPQPPSSCHLRRC